MNMKTENPSVNEQIYQSLYEHSENLIYTFDLEGHFVNINPAAAKLLDNDVEGLLHQHFAIFVHPEDLPHTLKNFNEVKELGVKRTYEARIFRMNGETRTLNVTNVPIYVNGAIVGVYGIARDITEFNDYLKQVEFQANYDYLTRLPNRRFLENKTKELSEQGQPYTLALLDLDGFKAINDTLGHDVGDEVLKEFAQYLSSLLEGTDITAGRWAGDEFLLMDPTGGKDRLPQLAKKIIERLKKPIYVKGFEVFVTSSIGISISRENFTAAQLIKQADIALYRAKSSGKRSVSIYSESYDIETFRRFTISTELQKAIAENQFHMEYQPRLSVRGKRVTSVESLLRWNHPTWGRISPDEFIPIAEETGAIVELGKWVLRTVCRETKPMVDRLNICVSVNVSVIEIMNKSFVSDLQDILTLEDFDPSRLELEITESALYQSEDKMKEFLDQLKFLGIRVSLDDFGKGYSSLSFLNKYEIETVKLDRSFIHAITEKERNVSIFSGIISLLQSLKINVVAEGVETKEQYAFLMKHRCEEAQGYLFSKPVPIGELPKVIQSTSNLIQFPANPSGVERRKLFRIPFKEGRTMELTIISMKSKPVDIGYTMVTVLDIGPGGLKLSLGVKLPISEDIIYRFSGNVMGEDISVTGKLVWSQQFENGSYHYGVSFLQSEKEQEHLVQRLNRVMLKRRV